MESNIQEINTKLISDETSKRITSLRFLLIILVVFIHSNLTVNQALNYYHYDFNQPKTIEIFKNFVCGTLGNASVPLFFLFASYLQFLKNDKYLTLLKKKSKKLLLPYILWTLITVFLYFVTQTFQLTAQFFMSPSNIVRNWNVFDYLKIFSYHKNGYPLVFQFWFLRDLMIFILVSPILKFFCEKFTGSMVIIITIIAVKRIPIFISADSSALFFYMAGYYFAKYRVSFFYLADRIKFIEYIMLLTVAVVFDLLFDKTYCFDFFEIIISCLFFLKLSATFIKHKRLYSKLEYLSRYSFFLYAVHMPFLGSIINKLSQKLIPLHGIFCLFQFLLAASLTICLGTIIGIVINKTCKNLFILLNGGRG